MLDENITPEELINQSTHLDPTLNQEMVPKSIAIQAINLARLEVLMGDIEKILKQLGWNKQN